MVQWIGICLPRQVSGFNPWSRKISRAAEQPKSLFYDHWAHKLRSQFCAAREVTTVRSLCPQQRAAVLTATGESQGAAGRPSAAKHVKYWKFKHTVIITLSITFLVLRLFIFLCSLLATLPLFQESLFSDQWLNPGTQQWKCSVLTTGLPVLPFFNLQVMLDSVTPWTVACEAPLSMKFARYDCWSGLPFPSLGILPNQPRDWICISCFGRRIIYRWATRESPNLEIIWLFIRNPWYGKLCSSSLL